MHKLFVSCFAGLLLITGCTERKLTYQGLSDDMLGAGKDTVLSDSIIYHKVRVDKNGNILPWYSANPGESYDFVLKQVWQFWNNMEVDSNGQKYYMNHQVWRPKHDKRGLGGDQLMMALSSWNLYYNYTGDESLIDNMKYMADYYLAHSLSSADSKWPNLPYPYNMEIHSGIYDGDMILGKDYLQPDKAGSFGYELVELYKKTGDEKYLDAAVKIANTLADSVKPGDQDNSPWPFKVNAKTGEAGILVSHEVWYEGMDKDLKKTKKETKKSGYTTFWTGTLNMFSELIKLKKGNAGKYQKAFNITMDWLKTYPAKNNKWGPFFEDVPRWSDTQINAVTYAMFIMEHPELDPEWKKTVSNIFKWVYHELGNKQYLKYGIICIDEQTAYRVPGNSHTARQASMDLMYWEKTGDTTYTRNAVRQLNWATYMVDDDGKNFYPTNDIWMTDGYGDYVRHYLRAMAAAPQLAPENGDHMLRTSSTIKKITYGSSQIAYSTFDPVSGEIFRLTSKPSGIKVNGTLIEEVGDMTKEGWTWQSLDKGGILRIRQTKGNQIEIIK
ncbi:MAG TPA: hypothetical protein VK616_16805 [Flavitalea sp.]|nr:hypothetical protein [Flavitalea sp.]